MPRSPRHFGARAARATLIGAVVGLLAWFSPGLVGTGESLTQDVIDGRFALSALTLICLVRFFMGPFSLAAGTPGGYFTPVLLLGALAGAAYGHLLGIWLPAVDVPPTALALAGMGAALALQHTIRFFSPLRYPAVQIVRRPGFGGTASQDRVGLAD